MIPKGTRVFQTDSLSHPVQLFECIYWNACKRESSCWLFCFRPNRFPFLFSNFCCVIFFTLTAGPPFRIVGKSRARPTMLLGQRIAATTRKSSASASLSSYCPSCLHQTQKPMRIASGKIVGRVPTSSSTSSTTRRFFSCTINNHPQRLPHRLPSSFISSSPTRTFSSTLSTSFRSTRLAMSEGAKVIDGNAIAKYVATSLAVEKSTDVQIHPGRHLKVHPTASSYQPHLPCSPPRHPSAGIQPGLVHLHPNEAQGRRGERDDC